jgi:hypothetical protein
MTRALPPASTDQYTALPQARLVATRALLAARENLADTIAARAMMCIHGGAGLGKTVAVTNCLRELEPGAEIHRITFHARPTTRAVRHEGVTPHLVFLRSDRASGTCGTGASTTASKSVGTGSPQATRLRW